MVASLPCLPYGRKCPGYNLLVASEQSPLDFLQAPSPWSVQWSHEYLFISLGITYPIDSTQLLVQCWWTMRPKVITHQIGVCSRPFCHYSIDSWVPGESTYLPSRTTVTCNYCWTRVISHTIYIYPRSYPPRLVCYRCFSTSDTQSLGTGEG